MRNKTNMPLLIINIIFGSFTLFLLFIVAQASIWALLLVIGLTGLVFLYNHISDNYSSAPIAPRKTVQPYSSKDSNGAFGMVKTVIGVAAFIAIVALAATAMLIARVLLLIATVLGGLYLIILAIRNLLR